MDEKGILKILLYEKNFVLIFLIMKKKTIPNDF